MVKDIFNKKLKKLFFVIIFYIFIIDIIFVYVNKKIEIEEIVSNIKTKELVVKNINGKEAYVIDNCCRFFLTNARVINNKKEFEKIEKEINYNDLERNNTSYKVINNKIIVYKTYYLKDVKKIVRFEIELTNFDKIFLKNIFYFDLIVIFLFLMMMYYQYEFYKEVNDYFKNENQNVIQSFNEAINYLEKKNNYLKRELQFFSDQFSEVVAYSKTNLFGIIIDVSKAFCELNGYKREELIGQPHRIVRHPETPSEFFKEMWETIENDKPYVGIIKNRRKDGSSYIAKTFVIPIYDEMGAKVGYFSVKHVLVPDADNVPLLEFIKEYEEKNKENDE